ncbi:conserved domain protein [Verrucomicrobiia bacterium DG1235]|nr:conserved domain protein [Verrucomicrobiae bacterium DG1235]
MADNVSDLLFLMRYSLFVFLITCFTASLFGDVQLASPFGEHMVLQRDRAVPIWGKAEPGERVTVSFASEEVSTTAAADGSWKVELKPMAASASPRVLTVSGSLTPDPIELKDVLVGEVWLCGGQSNMERQLGPRPPQKPIVGWKEAAAGAHFPLIRELYVKQTRSEKPERSVAASWSICSPETVRDFSAVGYFFARNLHKTLGVPVGIIHSSWGGTPAEAWTSHEGLDTFPEFQSILEGMERFAGDPEGAKQFHAEELARWYGVNDPGSSQEDWSAEILDTSDWVEMELPNLWEDVGYEGVDGVAWFRKTFDLPASWVGKEVELRLCAVDDADTTWINGVRVGATESWNAPRVYRVPASVLRAGENLISVRVLDTGGGGGIWNLDQPFELALAGSPSETVPLAGRWLSRFSVRLGGGNWPPVDVSQSAGAPTVLYNAMIAPLVPFALRGVAFYQGEANAGQPEQYRRLLPALIEDWRRQWNQGAFPFLFVQIAPFEGMPPEIREAQLFANEETENTAMIVTIDVGDAEDIHPAEKAPVGERLAIAARALAYGESIEYSGPVFDSMEVEGSQAVLQFTHLGGGLVAKDGPLYGFVLAGKDGIFYKADAKIEGDSLLLTSPSVLAPVAARYAWKNVASGNLFNAAGLPASPFRTDAKKRL